MLETIFGNAVGVALIVVLVLMVIVIGVLFMWKKVPQDKALVVTGLKKRVISGGGGFVVPILERCDLISLENMQIDVKVTSITSAGVELSVGALTILKIKNTKEQILAAMEQFNTGRLIGTVENVKNTSREVLEGKLREILTRMTVEEINQDREKFAVSVQEVAAKELEDMGLEIKAFTIKEISDSQEYLQSLGKKQVAEVKKTAAIAESNANKEREITLAVNQKETAVSVAQLKKETEIQLAQTRQEEEQAKIEAEIKIADSNKEKALRILENEKETQRQKALTDSVYAIENNRVLKDVIETEMEANLLQEAKNVEITEAKMKVELTKKEQETTIAKQEALRKQEELAANIEKTAYAEAKKVMTEADANMYRIEKESEGTKIQEIKKAEAEAAKKKLEADAQAEAVRVQAISAAEAKKAESGAEALATEALGNANAKRIEAEGLAKAKAIEAEGLAEAAVIKEKAFAEAEAMQKKAEAYKQYGEAAMTEMIVKALPEITSSIAEAIAQPMSKIGNITIVDTSGGGNDTGASKVSAYATNLLTQMPEVVKATTGIDLISILNKAANNFPEDCSADDDGAR